MEDWLESYRNQSRYNLGESGHRARSVEELLLQSNVPISTATEIFLKTKLNDSPNWGRMDLREHVAHMHSGACEKNVLITTGTSEALFLLFRVLNPKKVALIVPAFQLLYELPEDMGASLIPLKIEWDESGHVFAPWKEWMQTLRKERPDTILWNHPHNPTGLTFSQEQLDELHDVCEDINARLIGDEHYRFLASSETDTLGPSLYRKNSPTYITGSFVKCAGTPGLRIGWCVGPHETLRAVQSEKNYTTHTVNPVSEWLATEVLKNLQSDFWNLLRKEWKENVESSQRFLDDNPNFYGSAPQGGLVFSTALKHELSEEAFDKKTKFLLENGLFLLPLTSMEFQRWNLTAPPNLQRGFGYRIGLGCSPKLFRSALEILSL